MKASGSNMKQAISNGSVLVGMWAALADPYAAELCANSTFDWMLVDAEHGPNDVRTVLAQLQARWPPIPCIRWCDCPTTTHRSSSAISTSAPGIC